MHTHMTPGRYPTLGEVRGYYAQPAFLDMLSGAVLTRQVHLVIPSQLHWELAVDGERVPALPASELSRWLDERITARCSGTADTERLPFYPSFHMSRERWITGQVDHSPAVGKDAVFESDQRSWHDAFADVATLFHALTAARIPHIAKFSGSRSLHIIVPFGDWKMHVGIFGDSQAHTPPIIRMPYSLNEDTGLVSLPITWHELPLFRPWQASLHLVRIHDAWLDDPIPEERERTHEFFQRATAEGVISRIAYPEIRLDALRVRASSLFTGVPATGIWAELASTAPLTGKELCRRAALADAGTRWLIVEGYLLHGTELPMECITSLLADTDPYVYTAIRDLMECYSDQAVAYFLQVMNAEYLRDDARALYTLALSETLRERVIAALCEDAHLGATVIVRLACAIGVYTHAWSRAWVIVDAGAERFADMPEWAVRVQALRLIEKIMTWQDVAPQSLATLGPGILDLLLLTMGTENRLFRWKVFRALCLLADPRAIDVYTEELGSRYRNSVRWATSALLALGPEMAISPLLTAAASDDNRIRAYAIRCLGLLGDPRGYEAIYQALDDFDPRVVRQAVIAVRAFATPADIRKLRDIALTHDRMVRIEVMQTLLALGDVGQQAVESLAIDDGEPAAAGILWRAGDLRARDILLDALHTKGVQQQIAIEEIAQCPSDPGMSTSSSCTPTDPVMLEALIAMLPTPHWWFDKAIAGLLVRIGDPRGLEAILVLAHSDDKLRRKAMASALWQWEDPRTLATLVELLDDEGEKTRKEAANGFAAMSERARPSLEAIAVDPKASGRQRGAAHLLLSSLELERRLRTGEPLNEELLAMMRRRWIVEPDPIVAILRERNRAEDFALLIRDLNHPKPVVFWTARCVLLAIGEPILSQLTSFAATAKGKPAQLAQEIIEEIRRQQEHETEDDTIDPGTQDAHP